MHRLSDAWFIGAWFVFLVAALIAVIALMTWTGHAG